MNEPSSHPELPAGRRANLDWFCHAGWGVFCHYLTSAATTADEWNRRVDRFDVNALADQLSAVGAPYLFLTIGQGSGHYCAPNETYDRLAGVRPGKCSRRDLIGDLHAALQPRGISLMVYAPADGSWADAEARRGLGLVRHWSDGRQYSWSEYRLPVFQRNWEDVCRDWAQRFGRKVRGWWIDGAYHRKERYPEDDPPNLRTLAQSLRCANPDAIIAFNSGANALVVSYTQHEDFTSGEMIGNLPVCEMGFYQRFVGDKLPEADYGPVRRWINGRQYHMLNFLGSEWGKGPPRLGADLAAAYTAFVIERGAVISWDVPIEPSGRIAESFIAHLAAIGRSADRARQQAQAAVNRPG
jgi:hypothetical protein